MSLRPRIRKLASETAVYGVSSVFGRLINFLLFPFYSNVFAPDIYGPVIVVYAAFVFLNIIYQYGMESAYLKYAADTHSDADRKTVFSTAVWSLLATAGMFSAGIYFFQQPFGALLGLGDQHLSLLSYVAGILVLDTLTVVPYAELRLQNRPWMFAFVRSAGIVVNVALNLVFILGMGMGIESIFLANLLASGTSLALLTPVFSNRLQFTFSRPLLGDLLRFGLPFVPGGLGYALSDRVNIFFLERLPPERILELYGHDPAVQRLAASEATVNAGAYSDFIVGAYGGMVKLAIILALVIQMFRYAWQPFFLQHADDDDAPLLFSRIFTLLTAFLLTVYLAVAFFAKELVSFPLPGGRYLIAPAYWLGLSIIPIALLGYIFQGWYFHFSAGAYIRKKTGYFVICTLAGSAVALGLNIAFVPRYGMVAAAWATTASYVVMALLLLVLIRREYPIPYEWGRTLAMGAVALAVYLIWYLSPTFHVWWLELLLLFGFSIAALVLSQSRRRPITSS